MFNVLNVVHAGANIALTCLMRAMQLQLADGLSGTVYLQVDGGSENWNQVLFALIDLFFDFYPDLETVVVSRLAVGHTHIDVDRFFSYLNALLFGKSGGGRQAGANVLTREAFVDVFYKAMVGNRDTMLLKHVFEDMNCAYDFWEFLRPHLYSGFSGYVYITIISRIATIFNFFLGMGAAVMCTWCGTRDVAPVHHTSLTNTGTNHPNGCQRMDRR